MVAAANTARNLFKTFKEAREKKTVLQKVREYRRYIQVEYESDDYLVKTAEGGADLLKVLQLRHEVFVEEWQGRKTFHGLDVDAYDFNADHLMIFDKRINEVIGTYRLLSSHFTQNFYSMNEFTLSEFMRIPAVKLEMGRACVHPNFRDGVVIDQLWKGLSQYITKSKTEYLFGCSSIKNISPIAISRLFQTFKDQGSWTDEFAIRATYEYEFTGFKPGDCTALDHAEKRALLPPLLRSYLHAGARVYGTPALDRDFSCTDIMTILKWSDLNGRFQSRFG